MLVQFLGYKTLRHSNESIMEAIMVHLFSPLTLKSVTFRNRVVMAPMCMYSADANGFTTDFHKVHYETRAIGGVGLVLTEATSVESRGRISGNDLGIWHDNHVQGLKEIVASIHAHGSKAGVQLAHAGRKCNVLSEDVVGPSPITFDAENPAYKIPREMTHEDIKTVIHAFKEGARRANEAGFDVIEIHGAHGYLINSFLSPLTNKRTDAYGYASAHGTLLLSEIIQAITEVWPHSKPIFLRISAEDYAEDGNSPVLLGEALKSVISSYIDLINVSSGGVVLARVPAFDGYQIKFAEQIHAATQMPVMAGGRIKAPEMADEIIRNNRADMVYLGRQLLIDPYWTIKSSQRLGHEIDYAPKQYDRWKTSL